MHSDNIVYYMVSFKAHHALIQVLPSLQHLAAKGNSLDGSVVKSTKGGFRRPINWPLLGYPQWMSPFVSL